MTRGWTACLELSLKTAPALFPGTHPGNSVAKGKDVTTFPEPFQYAWKPSM